MSRTLSLGFLAALAASPALAQTARVQVIHNCADAAASVVDVWLDNTLLIDDFAFRTASPFVDAPAGTQFTVGIAPSNSTSAVESIFTQDFTLADGETYVVVASGIVSATGYTPLTPFSLEVFDQGQEAAMMGTNTDVLVLHGSTDAPTVDVYESAVLNATAVNDASYGDFAGYLALPTADYTVQIRTADNSTIVAAYSAPLQTLSLNGAAITVLASGFLDPSVNSVGPAFGLWAATAAGGALVELPSASIPIARAQVIHNSADAAAAQVDVYLNGGLLLDNFAFRTATPFVDLQAGVDLEVAIAPSTSTSVNDAIATFPYNLAAGETYTLVANGIVSGTGYMPNQPFGIDVFAGSRETATSGPANTDILVCHGSTDAPVVDVNEVLVLGGATLVDDIAYGEYQGYVEAPTADYALQITAGGNPVVTYQAPLATLNLDGAAITVLASGFLDPSMNSNGAAFGLWVALPAGGPLVELPELVGGGTARVQVIHNSADLAAAVVDVYLDNTLLLDDFAFRTASPFVDAPAGTPFVVGVAPGNSTSAADAIYTETFTLADGETYVIVASGIVSATGYAPLTPFSLEVFDQGRESAGLPANTDLLVFHGSTDAPTVDVYEAGVLNVTAVNDASYGDFAGYLELPTDDYTVQVRTADNSTVVAAYSAPLQTLSLNGAAITVLASGFLDPAQNSNGPGFGLWVALAAGGPLVELPSAAIPGARLQVIHNSADLAAAEVDVYLNGSLLLDDFAFRTATPFVDVQAGTDLSVAIAPGNSTSVADAIATFPFNLATDGKYIVVANGIVSTNGYSPNPGFDLFAYAPARESATSGANNTDILVFHGCTDAPAVDVNETALLGGATLVNAIEYGEFSSYLEPPTNDYVLQVTDGTTPLVSYQAPLATLNLEGDAITVLASGFLNPAVNSNGPGFGLWVALAAGGNLVELPVFTGMAEQGLFAGSSLWPNPATNEVNVFVPALGDAQVEVELLDAAGRVVRSFGAVARGNDRVIIGTSDLSAGRYSIRLSATGSRIILPLSVVR